MLQCEVGRVVGAEARARGGNVDLGCLAILADEGHQILEHVALEEHVALDAPARVALAARPGLGHVRFRAVELEPARLDQLGQGLDHAVGLPLVGHARGRGEDQQRRAEVAVAPQVDVAVHRPAG